MRDGGLYDKKYREKCWSLLESTNTNHTKDKDWTGKKVEGQESSQWSRSRGAQKGQVRLRVPGSRHYQCIVHESFYKQL